MATGHVLVRRSSVGADAGTRAAAEAARSRRVEVAPEVSRPAVGAAYGSRSPVGLEPSEPMMP